MKRALFVNEVPARMREERARRGVTAEVAAAAAAISVSAWTRLEQWRETPDDHRERIGWTRTSILLAVAQWLGEDIVIPSGPVA